MPFVVHLAPPARAGPAFSTLKLGNFLKRHHALKEAKRLVPRTQAGFANPKEEELTFVYTRDGKNTGKLSFSQISKYCYQQ